MGKIFYDFREGLDQEKIVYKNTSMDCKSFWYYIGYLIATWIWACGWFAIFQYSYINHEPTAFWVYIGCWLAFVVVLLGIIGGNLIKYYRSKEEKRIAKLADAKKAAERERKLKEEALKNMKEKHQNDYVVSIRNNENDKLNNL